METQPDPLPDDGPFPVSDDALLDGRVSFRQPVSGYRAAIDPVLLAASVPATPGQRVLDMGAGVGAAMLCLAARCPDVAVDGIEIQSPLVRLARHNIVANEMQGRVRVFLGDVLSPPDAIAAGGYDHVIANPPYQTAAEGHPPPDAAKRIAHVEGEARLADWVMAAQRAVRRKGRVTFIQHGERLAHLLATLEALKGEQAAGDISVLPLLPHAGKAASRVIVSWRKGVRTPMRLLAGVALHEAGGAYTPEIEAVLAGGSLAGSLGGNGDS